MSKTAGKAILLAIAVTFVAAIVCFGNYYEYYFGTDCENWSTWELYYRCNHTHRCWFFIYKGCYKIEEQTRSCSDYRQKCWFDDYGNFLYCEDAVWLRTYWENRTYATFQWCYCDGADPNGCW